MLDRKFILDNLELVKKNCENRGVKAEVERFAAVEERRKKLQMQVEELNRQANQVSKSIGQAKDPAERDARKEEGRKLREQTQAAQTEVDALGVEADRLQRRIPNLSHPSAPIGVDDQANLELFCGKTPLPKFDFQPLDHVDRIVLRVVGRTGQRHGCLPTRGCNEETRGDEIARGNRLRSF